MNKLILASGSPRRKEILAREGYSFDIIKSEKEDPFDKFCPPEKFSVRCAFSKAMDVYSRADKTCVVLGADTVVSIDGILLGKPKDRENAQNSVGKRTCRNNGICDFHRRFFRNGKRNHKSFV